MTPKNKINSKLAEISRTYHKEIPLSDIFGLIESESGIVVDESGEKWSGFLCGREGRLSAKIQGIKTVHGLYLSWYKMQVSGNYEITAYIG